MNDQILPDNQGQSQSPSNYLEALVGPDKKFSDQEALAKSKWLGDEYIKTLEAKLDNATADIRALREANTSQANMQELIDQFKQTQTKSDTTLPPQSEIRQPTIDLTKIEELINTRVKLIDSQKSESANLSLVQTKIKEKWGENVPASVKEQIEKLGDLGVTLAKKYPDEFLRTIGAEQVQRQSYVNPPKPGFNADTFKPQGSQERTWAFYEDLRKKDPTLYYSKKMSVQMHNDALRLGDRFMDGDFNADDKELLATKYLNS